MKGSARRVMVLLLIALMILTAWARMLQSPNGSATAAFIWQGFLFGLPVLLIAFLLAGARWALMAGVIYGTIGLALDISTLVQELVHRESRDLVIVTSGVSGLLNFLIIVVGGRGFLDVGPVESSAPPGDLPPNPPSLPAT